MLLTHPERTVYSVKRLMGRGLDDVQEELKLFPVPHCRRQRVRDSSCNSATRRITPPEISAHILRKLKQNAEANLGEPITQGRDHRSGVFQRCAAAGHQGCRTHRRAGSSAAGE